MTISNASLIQSGDWARAGPSGMGANTEKLYYFVYLQINLLIKLKFIQMISEFITVLGYYIFGYYKVKPILKFIGCCLCCWLFSSMYRNMVDVSPIATALAAVVIVVVASIVIGLWWAAGLVPVGG